MRRVTADDLRDMAACSDQVELFERHYPNGARVTVPTVCKMLRLGLDVEWYLDRHLSAEAWADYRRHLAPLWAHYQRQLAPLWAKYRQHTPLLAKYRQQRAPLLEEYYRQEATLWEDCRRQKATLIVNALRAEQ